MSEATLHLVTASRISAHDAVLSTLDKIAKALGVNVGDLYEVLPDEECDGSGVVMAIRGE